MLLSCVPFLYYFPWRKHVAAWFALALMWVGLGYLGKVSDYTFFSGEGY